MFIYFLSAMLMPVSRIVFVVTTWAMTQCTQGYAVE